MIKFGEIAQDILGRKIESHEGIQESILNDREIDLKIKIPPILREFYLTLGNNALFVDGFQHFAQTDELLVKDNKLVFLQENQTVVYWALDLEDGKSIYQTSDQNFEIEVNWFKEDFDLMQFLEMLLYFQCVMSDDGYHQQAISGFEYFASLDFELYKENPKAHYFIASLEAAATRVIKGGGFSIFWNPLSIIMCFTDDKNQVNESILSCSKDKAFFDQLVTDYNFQEL